MQRCWNASQNTYYESNDIGVLHSHEYDIKNWLFKKWEGTLATRLFKIDQRKFVKDMKVLTSELRITQSKLLVCDFKMTKVKDIKEILVCMKKI